MKNFWIIPLACVGIFLFSGIAILAQDSTWAGGYESTVPFSSIDQGKGWAYCSTGSTYFTDLRVWSGGYYEVTDREQHTRLLPIADCQIKFDIPVLEDSH